MRVSLCVVPATLLLFIGVGPGRADDQADMRKVIARAIKAHGGAEKLAKFKAATFKLKGKSYAGNADGVAYTGDWSVQTPDKIHMEIVVDVNGMEFKFVIVVNGNKGWTQLMGKTTAMDKETLAEAKEDLYASQVAQLAVLRKKGFKFAPLGEVKVGGKPAIGVQVSHKGHRDINLFFNKKTSLLVKTERSVKDTMGGGKEYTQTAFYSDYKKIEGIQHARKIRILRDGKKYIDGTTSDFKPEEKLDDSVFAKP